MKKKVTKEEQTQMNAKEFKKALEYIVKEKGIDEDVVIEAMQTALSTAFRKNEKADYNSRVLIDKNTGDRIYYTDVFTHRLDDIYGELIYDASKPITMDY